MAKKAKPDEKNLATNRAASHEFHLLQRIEAGIVPVVGADADAIVERSRDAIVVFLPLRLAGLQLLDPFGGDCDALVGRLPLVALVGAGEAVELGEEPQQPPAAAESPAPTA